METASNAEWHSESSQTVWPTVPSLPNPTRCLRATFVWAVFPERRRTLCLTRIRRPIRSRMDQAFLNPIPTQGHSIPSPSLFQ